MFNPLRGLFSIKSRHRLQLFGSWVPEHWWKDFFFLFLIQMIALLFHFETKSYLSGKKRSPSHYQRPYCCRLTFTWILGNCLIQENFTFHTFMRMLKLFSDHWKHFDIEMLLFQITSPKYFWQIWTHPEHLLGKSICS